MLPRRLPFVLRRQFAQRARVVLAERFGEAPAFRRHVSRVLVHDRLSELALNSGKALAAILADPM
jgi:hypothetical protein